MEKAHSASYKYSSCFTLLSQVHIWRFSTSIYHGQDFCKGTNFQL